MKTSVALPYLGAKAVARLARLAEESGWDGCFVGDTIWGQDAMIALAAAALSTQRIRLGTMITPLPLRRPWKLASESLALDHLSDGRLILGLGPGAVWMGWHGFPDEVSDNRLRAGMLDEGIDILTLLYQRKPFDYDGQYFHLKLSAVDEIHYPPKPVQQPRIPLWVVGVVGKPKSMRRVLKCDGIIVEARRADAPFSDPTPEDIAAVRAFAAEQRRLDTPFDIVVNGSTHGLSNAEARQRLAALQSAGMTWWIEGLWELDEEGAAARIRRCPPLAAD